MKCRAKPILLIDAKGKSFLATPISFSSGVEHLSSLRTAFSRRVVARPMTFWMVGVEGGTKKRSTPNGSAPISKRKTISGRKG